MVELTPSFMLEYESLDRDHQHLADIVNRIVQAIDDGEAEKCEDLVLDLVQSAKEHFASEEALLIKVGYPNLKKHQDHHKSLNTKMEHLLEFAKMAGENQMAGDSLRKELVFFLMDDVITTDMEFKSFIEETAKPEKA
ncbi:MAG: hemerythrin family protein [Proteobacteria bacterium]|nr:hemerythrin family protein [Pseudomonadota bacterium]